MKKIVIGNLKMNKIQAEMKQYLISLISKLENVNCQVVVCPSFTSIPKAVSLCKGTRIEIGAQNIFHEKCGAYTGEISPEMLIDLNVKDVIIGHSERRKYFGETNKTINKKIKAALSSGFRIIFCFGETMIERDGGKTAVVLKKQIEEALSGLYENELHSIVFAYEPVWSIGTGRTASEKQIEETSKLIRLIIKEIYSDKASKEITLVYGGSINPSNAKKIFAIKSIDGGLVGGASLDADKFVEIIKA